MRTSFNLLLGVLIEIQVQCFQEGICPQKDPPRGVQVLAAGTNVTLHCSGQISVDMARPGGGPRGGAEGEARATLPPGVETVAPNRTGLMEGADSAGGAGETLDPTGEGSVSAGLNGSEAGSAGHANASGADGGDAGARGEAPGTEGRVARGLGDRAQWRVNGRVWTRGGEAGDTLRIAPLLPSDRGNYSCHRGGKKVFSVEIVVAVPLEQPTLSCYRKTPTSKIRCDWTSNKPITPTPRCYLILKKGLYGRQSKVNCSFSPSRARCWCAMEQREGEKDAFQATLCVTSITGNATSPTIEIHPENIIKPDPPTNVTVHKMDGMEHRLKVTWKYPHTWSPNFYRLYFQLEYFPLVKGQAKEAQTVVSKGVSYTMKDILPRTEYVLRVRAKEEFDLGQWSDWSPQLYARSWTAPEPSASSDVHSSSNPFDPFITESGDGSGSEMPSESSPSTRPTLTLHLSWVLAACVLGAVVVLAVYILRHREQFTSKLFKLARCSTSHTPAPHPSQLPREEGNPLVPGPSAPPSLQEEGRGEGIHLNNMGYFLVQTN
ncbi:interleukin-6 receptor subunit alpha [Conger conger]|uniref:interleukin-6 receptor subunit alpha n=1 Tax=Conger conger TaxID=82655 RepID=UPI002A598941|nr:interleukin-6 receptor subunit alpha [Conger conger]